MIYGSTDDGGGGVAERWQHLQPDDLGAKIIAPAPEFYLQLLVDRVLFNVTLV